MPNWYNGNFCVLFRENQLHLNPQKKKVLQFECLERRKTQEQEVQLVAIKSGQLSW